MPLYLVWLSVHFLQLRLLTVTIATATIATSKLRTANCDTAYCDTASDLGNWPTRELRFTPLQTKTRISSGAHCKGMILFHILISSHFLLLASIFEFQCFGLFSGLTCPKFMGLEPLCYSYFCAFLGLLSVTWLSHVTLCPVAVICCKMSLICTCLHIFVHICTY